MSIANKLQTLIDGKQYVVDKTNTKANTELPLNCTWEDLGNTIENISGGSGSGGENTLKKLLDYTQSTANLFNGNITITDVSDYIKYDDTENVTNMSGMFYNCDNLTSIHQLNTSNVTNMSGMFYNCDNLTSIPQLNTSNVTTMASMFNNCKNLESIPQLDTSKVASMQYMFQNCIKLTSIPQLNTSNVTTMASMFNGCNDLKSISQLDTSKVTDMQSIFNNCKNLEGIPQLNTSNVTQMNGMFSGCIKLTSISQLNTSKATNINSIFNYCQNLESIPQLDTSKVANMGSAFSNCKKLSKVDISYYNLSSSSSYSGKIFEACSSLKQIIIRGFGSKTSIYNNAFSGCSHLTGAVHQTYNPNGDKDCYIYVPQNMVDTLKSATNWSAHADQIRALEDYTVDGTTTGDLDESKI